MVLAVAEGRLDLVRESVVVVCELGERGLDVTQVVKEGEDHLLAWWRNRVGWEGLQFLGLDSWKGWREVTRMAVGWLVNG